MDHSQHSPEFERLRERLAADLGPVRPFAGARGMLLFLAGFAPLATLLLWQLFGGGSGFGMAVSPWVWGLSAAELVMAAVLLGGALREATPGRLLSLATLGAGALVACGLHVAVILVTYSQNPVAPAPGYEIEVGTYCFLFEVLLGLPCLIFALWLSSRGLTTTPWRVGWIAGLGAGLAADSVWRLVCPYSEPAHAFGAHTSGIFTVVVVGLAVAMFWQWLRHRSWRRV